MSALILFLYSKYYPNINIILNIVSSIDYIHTMCVDNQRVREVIMRSSLVRVKKVPCFVVVYPNGEVNQYVDEDMSLFMNTLLKKGKGKGDKKTPIQNLVDDIPDTKIEINETIDDTESEIEESAMQQGARLTKPYEPPPEVKAKYNKTQPKSKSGKTSIGDLINFQTSDTPSKSSSVSRSRSELMNRENVKITKGQGHGSMQTSSLGNDISTTKSIEQKDSSNLIEDIGEEDDVIPFAPEEHSGMLKETHKSKVDVKSLAMEMQNERGEK
jgi:hypothetical protein